jgi:hypothetical protein
MLLLPLYALLVILLGLIANPFRVWCLGMQEDRACRSPCSSTNIPKYQSAVTRATKKEQHGEVKDEESSIQVAVKQGGL